jgi:heptosyltransferase-3
MGSPGVIDWLPGRTVVAAVSSFDRGHLATLFQLGAVPAEALQRFLGSFELILSYATAPQHIFAQNLARWARGRVVHFDARPRPDIRSHMSEHLQQPLRELGLHPTAEPPHLTLTVEDRDAAARCWAEYDLGGHYVVAIHPGSGSPAKNWPAERFAEVVRHLHRSLGVRVLLVCGPADADVVSQVERALGEEDCTVLDGLPVASLAAVLSRCQAYLGNDSGISHLAAAVGVPTLAVFGPTDPAVWAPRGPCVRVLSGGVPCAPCSWKQSRSCGQRLCLEAVMTDAVIEVLDDIILAPDWAARPMWRDSR